MDKFIIGIIIFAFLLWLPFFMAGIIGHNIWLTMAACLIWIPIIGAFIHASR